jgi:fructose-1,6-bisphosphatase/inositol monophosphatase family enzyme
VRAQSETRAAHDEYLRFAMELAAEAGLAIKEAFDSPHTVTFKADRSPVTEVDMRINALVIDRIRERYPDHSVRGEEGDYGESSAAPQWICDPLDGTSAFVLGMPNSLFMLALAVEGELALAVVQDPYSGRRYHATAGGGAFCDGRPIRVNQDALADGCVLLGADSFPFAERVKRSGARLAVAAGAGYKAMMIARGLATATIRASADIHDVAPAALVVREAGGRVSALDGSPIHHDRNPAGVIVSNGVAHAQLVEIAGEVRAQA